MPFVNELGLFPIPSKVTIPTVQVAIDENGQAKEEKVVEKVNGLITELEWYAEALKARRVVAAPPS